MKTASTKGRRSDVAYILLVRDCESLLSKEGCVRHSLFSVSVSLLESLAMCLCVCLSPHDLNFRFRLSRLGVLHSLKALCFTTIFTRNDQITLIYSYHSVWLFAIHEYTQPENAFSLCLDPAGHEKLAFFYLLMLLVLLFSLLLTFFFVYRVRVAGVLFHFSFSKLLLRPLALTILR